MLSLNQQQHSSQIVSETIVAKMTGCARKLEDWRGLRPWSKCKSAGTETVENIAHLQCYVLSLDLGSQVSSATNNDAGIRLGECKLVNREEASEGSVDKVFIPTWCFPLDSCHVTHSETM